jgi:hypothetical protein
MKTAPVGREQCSSCGTWSEAPFLECEGEVRAGVDDCVEDGIDVAVGVHVVELFLLVD